MERQRIEICIKLIVSYIVYYNITQKNYQDITSLVAMIIEDTLFILKKWLMKFMNLQYVDWFNQ